MIYKGDQEAIQYSEI